MNISGLVTGSLGVQVSRQFLANSIALKDVSVYSFEIYSTDYLVSAQTIQSQIQQQFLQVYSGDINTTVFQTQNTYAFPSDSLKASKFNVTVEVHSPVTNIVSMFPELTGNYYEGLDTGFFINFGTTILDFKEDFSFATNADGNRNFNHALSFGIRTGISGTNTATGRRALAAQIASGIFAGDTGTSFGLYTMVNQISGVGNTGIFRNYYTESVDLFKNQYSFSRKREELPFDGSGIIYNLTNSLEMGTDGVIQVSERTSTFGKINFAVAETTLDYYLSNSYGRCVNIYSGFYNSGVINQDSQYLVISNSGLLPLINTPVKTIKTYDARSLSASYETSFTNNPTFSGDGTITAQLIEFKIGTYNLIEASHTFDYTVNRIINNSGYFQTLMNNTTGISPTTISNYYTNNFSVIDSELPEMNMVSREFTWPNIKTRGSCKFEYSNNPSYFVTVNGLEFNVLDVKISNKKPVDIVNEFKIVNRPNNLSVLSYAYQTEKGEISISFNTQLGKQSNQFALPSGNFSTINGIPLANYLTALYQYGGTTFLNQLNTPNLTLNWFLESSRYSFNSDGKLVVEINYVYTWKKRLSANNP